MTFFFYNHEFMDLNAFDEFHHVCGFRHNTADRRGSQIATEGKACD